MAPMLLGYAVGAIGVYALLYRFAPVRAEDGSVVAIHSAVTETTARVRAEAALRDSEERFRLAVQSASLGSFDLEAGTLRLHWSESARRMFGYDGAAELVLADPLSRIHPDDRPKVAAAIISPSFVTAGATGRRSNPTPLI